MGWVGSRRPGARPDPTWFPSVSPGLAGARVIGGGCRGGLGEPSGCLQMLPYASKMPPDCPDVSRSLPDASQSWAGPAWFRIQGPQVMGRAGLVLAWGPRVLGRAALVLNTSKNRDSDENVNIILR